VVYLITFDLHKPVQDYEAAYEAIKLLGETCCGFRGNRTPISVETVHSVRWKANTSC